ncbi:hypothetical protein BJ138DRAFT_765044 [Hygrophoropsis aurantiaca]|uniref:Uncharacterized protein n=1 Tax=Hygrophoropsis aurantiaca TaxID=72124 RepID=A0ACB8ATC5_9AGAM|nr:hypothetical protein BJ138DRAFT_765044 [Hygrophoropsis aurantiaca]
MGGTSSKAIRKLPKEKPTWAGARTPSNATLSPKVERPLASETRNEAIETDARDPQFMSNLNRLGPVRVDHHMQTIRVSNSITDMYRSRAQSEVEASPSHATQNRLLASSLSELLEARKTISSLEEEQDLAKRYGIDPAKLTELSRFVNTPSIDEKTVVRTMNTDGEETMTMMAHWVEPKLENARS